MTILFAFNIKDHSQINSTHWWHLATAQMSLILDTHLSALSVVTS